MECFIFNTRHIKYELSHTVFHTFDFSIVLPRKKCYIYGHILHIIIYNCIYNMFIFI